MWFALGPEFVAQGCSVLHISRRHSRLPDREEIAGVRHERLRGFDSPKRLFVRKILDFFYSLQAWWRIPRDADIVITSTFWLPMLCRGSLAARVCVDVQRMPKGQMKLYQHVGRLRANSTPVAAAIRDELPASAKARVAMIPNPLPFLAREAVADYETRPREILYVGRVHPEKGLDIFLQAARQLDLQGWKINIVGPWAFEEGGGGDEYRVKLGGLSEGLPVEFFGAVHDMDRLNEFYRSARIFLYPSIAEKGETFGLAPLEAMAWGCVPVVSALECFQDFIGDGRNGLVFDHRAPAPHLGLARAVERLVGDADLGERLSRVAIDVRSTHSTSKIAADFLTEFRHSRP